MPALIHALLFLLCSGLASPLRAGPADSSASPRLSGELRLLAAWAERVDRSAQRSDEQALRSRLRLALDGSASPTLSWRVRLAARPATDQLGTSAYLRFSPPGRTGAEAGDATFDEAWLQWQPEGVDWLLRIGRFQQVSGLAAIQAKGLAPNDGPNLDIQWTDGLRLESPLGGGRRGTLLLRYLPPGGPGSVHRQPLDFGSGAGRIGGALALDWVQALGPLLQRRLALDFYPQVLAQGDRRADYAIATARATAAWPLSEAGWRLLLGGELGHAVRAPAASRRGAWHLEGALESPGRRHGLSLVHGRVGSAWLVSSDFRGNDELSELRYLWRVTPQFSLDARWRWRREIELPGLSARRVDRDAFLRATWRFASP